jgi:signal transduction histidine kinase
MNSMFAVSEPVTAQWGKTEPASTHARMDLRSEPSLGTLAMSIVHDLRNPLATIHSGAEILNRSPLAELQVRRLARNMYSASVRIQELLQEYVDLCRTNESQPLPSNLRSLVAEAVDRVAAVAGAQSVVVVQDVPADLVVTMDRGRIGSVLANLLANALEAMPAGGSIHITAIAAESSAVIWVLDTGPGIAPEIRDRLFQPFVTARKPNGWGLGLSHARQVVIDHGGEMWLESPPGAGACFGFSLPASPGSRQLIGEHLGGAKRCVQ